MTTDIAAAAPEFRVGRVLSRGFGVLFRNLGPFLLLGMAASLPSFVLDVVGIVSTGIEGFDFDTETWSGGIGTAEFMLSLIVSAMMVYGTVQDLRGHPAGFKESIQRGFELATPALVVGFVAALIFVIGLLLFVIPGVIAMLVFWIALPVAVVERLGVGDSLRRSAALTKGHRWKVLAIILVWFAMFVAIAVGFFLLVAVSYEIGEPALTQASTLALDLFWRTVSLVLIGFITAAYAAITAVGYHDLRVAKDGVDTNQIAAVFD